MIDHMNAISRIALSLLAGLRSIFPCSLRGVGAIAVFSSLLTISLSACDRPAAPPQTCTPTPYDEIGPFYRPGAPERETVGTGYLLTGQVLSVSGCRPLANSRLEFWLVNPQGEYDDAHRATVHADSQGRYRFTCNRPTDYRDRLPHIHIMVTAPGHEQLITQHYPATGAAEATFNLVLAPVP
jgi:protocatechuate 3,4-dioxygenase beta subunit